MQTYCEVGAAVQRVIYEMFQLHRSPYQLEEDTIKFAVKVMLQLNK